MTVRSTDSHSGAVILIDTIVLNEGELNSESLSRKGVCLTDTLTSNEGIQRLSQGMNSIHTLKPYIEMRASGLASTDPLVGVRFGQSSTAWARSNISSTNFLSKNQRR